MLFRGDEWWESIDASAKERLVLMSRREQIFTATWRRKSCPQERFDFIQSKIVRQERCCVESACNGAAANRRSNESLMLSLSAIDIANIS